MGRGCGLPVMDEKCPCAFGQNLKERNHIKFYVQMGGQY
jgi:hypothetical protein